MWKTVLWACVFFVVQPRSMAQVASSADSRGAAPDATMAGPQRSEFVPMTQRERLRHYFKSAFGVEGLVLSTTGAGVSQWMNTPSEWGQGAEGYARRFGNSYAQHMIRSTLTYGTSSVLHEDNRYIPSDQSGFAPRLKYAITSSFLARRDDGSRHLSISRLSSYLATAFISREWQPHSTIGPQNAMLSFSTAMGTAVGVRVAREFFPTVFRRHRD